MIPTRLFIGLFSFCVIAAIICNFFTGSSMVENADVSGLSSAATGHTYSTAVESSTGISGGFLDMGISWMDTYLFWDYPIFYNIDPVSGLRVDNDFIVLRYLLLVISIVVFLNMFAILRGVIRGA